jgi:hypothetical protein
MKKALCHFVGLLIIAGLSPWCSAAADSALTKSDKVPSSYINSELPRWIKLSIQERLRTETQAGVNFSPDTNTYLLQRVRLNLVAAPRPWLSFTFQAQDSRVYFTNVSPVPSTQKSPIDLRVGYIQIGQEEDGPVSLRFGRQGLNFGEGRMLSDPDWSNVGRSFEAVRMMFHFRKFRLDAFGGISDKVHIDGSSTPTPGEHFDGLYGALDRVVPNALIEPYLFWKMEHNVKGELVKTGNLDEKTIGLRWLGKLPHGFDYGMESAMQRGSQANEPISAWATHLVAGFTLSNSKHVPRFFGEINRASGDRSATDGTHGAFDTLFAAGHDKFGLTDLFCWTNIVHVRAGFQYKVLPNLTLGLAHNADWLATRHDGLYSSGKLVIVSNGAEGRYIGQEPNIQARWNGTTGTQIDFAAGHLLAGGFLQRSNHGEDYNNVVAGVTQRF